MIQGSGAEESRGALESAGRRPTRKTLERNSRSLVRKSERLNKNSLEATTSQKKTDRAEDKSSSSLVRRSERGKSQSPLKCNQKNDESCSKSGAKDGPERVDAGKSEEASTKRRKLYTSPFRSFKSLFCQSKTNSVSISTEPSEKPELQRTLAQSNCSVPETEAVDKHQSVSSPSEKKLSKKSENFANDSDLRNGITPKIQTKEVLNVVKEKLSEHIVDHEFPESRCKENPIELDSSAGIESKIQSVGTLPVSDKGRPMERETEAHACVYMDCPVSPSHDNRGSTQKVESGKVEVSDKTRVTSKNEAATFKENSLHDNIGVDDEETIHSRERDADVVNNVVAQAISNGCANVSHSRNEVKDSSGRFALSPRSRQWKCVSDSSKRKRKIVNYNESEDVKKLIKVVHDGIDMTWTGENQKVITSDKGYKCAKDVSQVSPEDVCIPSVLLNTALESGAMFKESFKLHDTKKSLHLLLKPDLQKLCELLNLSEDVKTMAEQFIEYVVENHHVTREPVTLLHAFQLSVCWIAASLRKQKISYKDSLTLATKHLNFCCSAEDTDYMYLKMVLLKELFIQNTMDDTDNVSPFTDTSGDSVFEINPVTSDRKSPRVLDIEKLMVKIIRQINKKCRERMKLLIENQRKELEELQKSSDEEKRQLERDYKVEVAVVRTIHIHNRSMASEKVKALEHQHSKRLEEHTNNLSIRSKSLEHKHSAEKDKENKLTSCWKEDIIKEHLELLQKITHHNFEDGKRKWDSNEQLRNLDIQKECHAVEDQEVLKGQPQADSIEDCQSTSPEEASAVLPVSSDAGNNFGVVDSVVSDLAKVLPENFASICSETGQVACGEAANFVEPTSEMEVPESSSVDVLPLKSKTSAITDRPSPEKTLDCQTTLQQLSQSSVLIPDSGLLNPSIDVPLALSNGKAISALHEAEAPSLGHSVPSPSSPAALDNEVGNYSLGGDNVPPNQINFDAQTVKRQAEISTFASGFEQSDSHNKFNQSVLYVTTDHGNVDPIAKAVHQLPATEKQCELPPSTITTGSTQSQSDSQLLRAVTSLSSVNPTAAESVAQPPAIEGQPKFPSSSGTPRTEKSYSDIQLERLGHAETDHFKVERSTAERVHQLPATKRQLGLPCCIVTPGREQDHSDIQLDVSLLHSANHTFAISSTPGAVQQSPATERQVSSHSELSHSDNDHLLLNTTSGHFDPSAGEAVQLLSATDSIIAPSLEQSQSGIENGPRLSQFANNCNIDLLAAEAPHQLSARSEQSNPDYQNDNVLCQTATNQSFAEPSAGEASNQLPHSPTVDSSSSQPQSSLPVSVSEELPSRAFGSTLNVDAPNPYPSPSVVGVPSTSTCSIAITQSPSISVPGATNAVSDFPANLTPGTIVASTESVRMPNFSYLDPLESELVRVQKEADRSVKECEDMKQLLNSECEKEIEEIVAQIRKKYETKIVELDAAMKYKKNELDVYRSKVYMNKILAEILRKKFSESKVFVPPGIPQDNVQHQLRRQPPPVLADASAAVQSSGNLQGMHSSVPLRHSTLGSASSAAPIPRNVQGMQNPVGTRGPSAAALQNFLLAGVPSSASLQNSVHPRSPSAAALQNFLRAGAPSTAASLQNSNLARSAGHSVASSPSSLRSGGPSAVASLNYSRPCVPAAYSPDPMRPGVTTGIPLPRSAAASPSGLPSAVQQALQRPVQVLNHPAALLSDSSTRPVITASNATTPTVNLDSQRVIRAPAPHLRSRISQPRAPDTTFSARIPCPPSHPTFTNVSLPTPTAVTQHSSHHRPPPASIDNVPMHKTTVSLPTLRSNGVPKTQQVVCLSDSD